MKALILIITLFLSNAEAAIWYVDNETTAGDNGTSWEAAFDSIQEAIDNATAEDEIWVKEGIYFLTSQISVNKPVLIYGGFNGTETQRTQRDWENKLTVFNGEAQDGSCFIISANCIIDGVNITGSHAGGMIINSNSSTIANCKISSMNFP